MNAALRDRLEAAWTLPGRAFSCGIMSGFFAGLGLLMLLQGRPWLALISSIASGIMASIGWWIIQLDRFDVTPLLEAADVPAHLPRAEGQR
jgi:hypothetical protein